MKKITPFLWFSDKAEEAAKFYVSIFKNSRIGNAARYSEEAAAASGRPAALLKMTELDIKTLKQAYEKR